MADIVSSEKRSQMMAGIKGSNTKPEKQIRSLLHQLGFRFRLHYRKLPGKPDLVFPKYRAVIFIHGCFWHKHDCSLFKMPSSNTDFWNKKLSGNTERDLKDVSNLNSLGWKVMIIWECSLRGRKKLPLNKIAQRTKLWLEKGKKNTDLRCI